MSFSPWGRGDGPIGHPSRPPDSLDVPLSEEGTLHRDIYVQGFIAGLGHPIRARRGRQAWLAVVLATTALVLTAFWAGHAIAAPRPAPQQGAGTTLTASSLEASAERTGAPHVYPTVGPTLGVVPAPAVGNSGGAPTPRPSGGIDKGFYCSDPPACGYEAPTPTPVSRGTMPDGSSIAGQATWWASFGSGLYAAIRPDLGTKGDLAIVCGPITITTEAPKLVGVRPGPQGHGRLDLKAGAPRFHCLTLPITTTCACLGPNSDRLIDLSIDAFRSFADPSAGVIRITLQVLER